MKTSKGTIVAAAREAKRRLDNPLTEAQKPEKVAAEVERQRKIQPTAVITFENKRVEAWRRSVVKFTAEQKFEKDRVEIERRL